MGIKKTTTEYDHSIHNYMYTYIIIHVNVNKLPVRVFGLEALTVVLIP